MKLRQRIRRKGKCGISILDILQAERRSGGFGEAGDKIGSLFSGGIIGKGEVCPAKVYNVRKQLLRAVFTEQRKMMIDAGGEGVAKKVSLFDRRGRSFLFEPFQQLRAVQKLDSLF